MKFHHYQTIAVTLFIVCLSRYASSAEIDKQTRFAMPTFPAVSGNVCSPTNLAITRAPDNSAVSLLFNSPFLQASNGSKSSAHATCQLNLPFEGGARTNSIIQLDIRGQDIKERDAELSYEIIIGRQHHRFQYASGRILEPDSSAGLKRFQVALPRGAQKISVTIRGVALSLDGHSVARAEFDSIDVCAFNPDKQSTCGQ